MKQNKLLMLSLLASFLLLTSTAFAQSVTFSGVTTCPVPAGDKVYVTVEVDNSVDLGALDIVGEIVSVPPNSVMLVVTDVTFDTRMADPTVLDGRYPIGDLGGGQFRFGAAKVSGTGTNLPADVGQIATVELEFVSDCELGSATIDPSTYMTYSTAFSDAVAGLIVPTFNGSTVSVENTGPTFTNCPTAGFTIYWGDNINYVLTATDPDLVCGCDYLRYELITGPGNSAVDMSTGLFTFTAMTTDIGCTNPVQIRVYDRYGGEAFCDFNIEVLNEPPEFTVCPEDGPGPGDNLSMLWGEEAVAHTSAWDPDGGPNALQYNIILFNGPGVPTVDASGVFRWQTVDGDHAYVGDFHACVEVWDGAPASKACAIDSRDTCCFDIHVESKFHIEIEKVHDQLLGHYVDVSITVDDGSMLMGGFDFLIAYDATLLNFIEATPGQLLENCGWESFTYRYGFNGNCGNACPSGLLRIVAQAETNNGPYHPSCYGPPDYDPHELAEMRFYVVNDHNNDCMYAPIYWFWMDCGDNTVSSKFGDTLFLEDRVFSFDPEAGPAGDGELTDHPADYSETPSSTGTADICLEGDKEYPLRAIDFRVGGVDIICDDDIDARGDINVNGLAYEIADAVMFTNFFISGASAFGDHFEASKAASDANADGIALSIGDLVYLVRVIQGDALPYPKLTPGADNMAVNTQLIDNRMTVSYSATTEAGAALLTFSVNGEAGVPVLEAGANGMDVVYSVNGNEMRVLVYSHENGAIASGSNTLLTIPVNGDMELTGVDVADYFGSSMDASVKVLPTKFSLAQNYPNPFNPSTTIALALPVASDYTVAIYNVAGQLIRTYSGYASAGEVTITWDGKDASGSTVASGMYFYKAQASSFTATKKMLLMK